MYAYNNLHFCYYNLVCVSVKLVLCLKIHCMFFSKKYLYFS